MVGKPGYSQIFEEGLKDADAVLIVVSNNSVSKPWVRKELNSSVVSHIQKGTRLIPVVIDKCDVPESLRSTVWESIPDISNYNNSFDLIISTIFSRSIKPELGNPPDYVSNVLQNINGLEAIDNLILKASCDFLLGKPDSFIEPNELFGASNHNSPPKEEVLDSIDVLENDGYFNVIRTIGSKPEYWGRHYRVTLFGFEEYCKAYVSEYGQIVDKSAGLIVNGEVNTSYMLRDALSIPLMIANHVIRRLENARYVKVRQTMSGRIYIYDVSARLRRSLR